MFYLTNRMREICTSGSVGGFGAGENSLAPGLPGGEGKVDPQLTEGLLNRYISTFKFPNSHAIFHSYHTGMLYGIELGELH